MEDNNAKPQRILTIAEKKAQQDRARKRKAAKSKRGKARKPITEEATTKNEGDKPMEETKVPTITSASEEAPKAVSDDKSTATGPRTAARRERVPLGHSRMKLTAPQKAGKHRRWINDVGGRVQLAQEGGYTFVEKDPDMQIGDPGGMGDGDDTGSRVRRIVGTREKGDAQTAFLMEIDEDLYQEDQREKQRRLDEIDNQIRHGNIEGQVGKDGRYIPSEGISYRP